MSEIKQVTLEEIKQDEHYSESFRRTYGQHPIPPTSPLDPLLVGKTADSQRGRDRAEWWMRSSGWFRGRDEEISDGA